MFANGAIGTQNAAEKITGMKTEKKTRRPDQPLMSQTEFKRLGTNSGVIANEAFKQSLNSKTGISMGLFCDVFDISSRMGDALEKRKADEVNRENGKTIPILDYDDPEFKEKGYKLAEISVNGVKGLSLYIRGDKPNSFYSVELGPADSFKEGPFKGSVLAAIAYLRSKRSEGEEECEESTGRAFELLGEERNIESTEEA